MGARSGQSRPLVKDWLFWKMVCLDGFSRAGSFKASIRFFFQEKNPNPIPYINKPIDLQALGEYCTTRGFKGVLFGGF